MFGKSKDGLSFRPHHKEDSENLVESLPADIYTMKAVEGFFGVSITLKKYEDKEGYVEPVASEEYSKIKKLIDNTFNLKLNKLYSDLGYLNKTGTIMYGPPGTGKTVQAVLIGRAMVAKYNAICLIVPTYNDFYYITDIIKHIRTSEPDRSILIICDEAETLFPSPSSTEALLIQLLDGLYSINNFAFIGITNFYDKLSSKLKDRPSRIKLAVEITSVPYEVIKNLIKSKVPENYIKLIDVEKMAFTYSEEKKTIDNVKADIILKLEEQVLKEEADLAVQPVLDNGPLNT